MKSRFALLAMVVMAAAPLAAQGGGGGGGGGGMRGGGRGMNIDQMTTQYNLDASQKEKTQALIDQYNKDMAPMTAYMQTARQNGGVDPDSMKKSQAMRTDFNTKFKAILNADQAKMFDSVTAAQAARMGGRRGGGGGK